MSLLDRGYNYDPVVVYPEESYTDADGNTMTRAAATGIPAVARFQIQGQSGTSARRSEQQNEGFESERVYTVMFPRAFTDQHGLLGAQSKIEWDGRSYSLFGDPMVYAGSRRTRHVAYTVRRS